MRGTSVKNWKVTLRASFVRNVRATVYVAAVDQEVAEQMADDLLDDGLDWVEEGDQDLHLNEIRAEEVTSPEGS